MKSQIDLFVLILLLNVGRVCGEENVTESLHTDGHAMSPESRILVRHEREADIPREFLIYCGDNPPREIDTRVNKCKNFLIVPVSSPSTQRPGSELTPTRELTDTCSKDDMLICNDKVLCGAQSGYQCCGFGRFHPDFQTCCQYSSAKYKIYDGMPEENYICCGVDVYNRSSTDVPCEHPSSNDMFVRKISKPKMLSRDTHLCNRNTHETRNLFKIDVEAQKTDDDPRYLEATISSWRWDTTNTTYYKQYLVGTAPEPGYMKIPLDKYSPWKKNLIGKSFFTITTKSYLDKAIFFLSRRDNLYKWPKNKKRQNNITKRLRRVKKKCGKQNAKRRPMT